MLGQSTKKRIGITIVACALALGTTAPAALAAPNPSGTGQPNQECGEVQPPEPPGFGSRGFANAESHYAGEEGTPSAQHANSPHAVSQYDVACFQQEAKDG